MSWSVDAGPLMEQNHAPKNSYLINDLTSLRDS
jgi:hypothetical protein